MHMHVRSSPRFDVDRHGTLVHVRRSEHFLNAELLWYRRGVPVCVIGSEAGYGLGVSGWSEGGAADRDADEDGGGACEARPARVRLRLMGSSSSSRRHCGYKICEAILR